MRYLTHTPTRPWEQGYAKLPFVRQRRGFRRFRYCSEGVTACLQEKEGLDGIPTTYDRLRLVLSRDEVTQGMNMRVQLKQVDGNI